MGWGRDCQLNAYKKFVHAALIGFSRFIGRKVSDDDDDD
jgi:hypothetical protein